MDSCHSARPEFPRYFLQDHFAALLEHRPRFRMSSLMGGNLPKTPITWEVKIIGLTNSTRKPEPTLMTPVYLWARIKVTVVCSPFIEVPASTETGRHET
jgi:hypothetical protein